MGGQRERGRGRGRGRGHRVNGLPARQAAWRLLTATLCQRQLLHEAQQRHAALLDSLPAPDRALAEHITRTTLRRRGQLEHLLKRFLKRPLPPAACPAHVALLMGATQLLCMRTPPHAAISTTVELLKRHTRQRHLAGLANAVLRRLSREDAALLEQADITLNIPAWLRQRLLAAYGGETLPRMAAELLREPPLDISVKNAAEIKHWAQRLNARLLPTASLRIEQPKGRIDTLPGHAEGTWWVQDAAAALPVLCAGDVRGARVADLCAAPGGKTAQLAARGARVEAVDISAARLRRLHANLQRLNLAEAVKVIEADVLQWQPEEPPDVVLLDAPCTATGTFRRHPDVLFAKSERQLAQLTGLQQRMLRHAAGMLPPGGVLIYCVCSLLLEEGEEQVERFLASEVDQQFTRQPIQPEEIGQQTHFITTAGDVRTLPHYSIGDEQGLDGFFIARLRRNC